MSVLYVWIPTEPERPVESVLQGMRKALRANPSQRASEWSLPGLAVGIPECDPCGTLPDLDPVRIGDRHFFWVVGEVFAGGKLLEVAGPEESRRLEFRSRLFEALSTRGFEGLESLDGEYLLVHWDGHLRTMTLANDRFGGLPIYVAQSREGIAIA